MKVRTLAVCLLLAAACSAKEHDYQTATIVRVDSSACGTQEKTSKSLAPELVGTDGRQKKTPELVCQDYVLQSFHVIFRIRRNEDKHPALLPIGETAQFRIAKGKLVVRVPELDRKEREYDVISIAPLENERPITASK